MFFSLLYFFFFNDTATPEIYTLSLHDALPISTWPDFPSFAPCTPQGGQPMRSKFAHSSAGASSTYCFSNPKPPRHLPAPPESWRKRNSSTRNGYIDSCSSIGIRRVSPCAMVRNGPAPSCVAQAPQPPWPLSLALNTAPVSMRLPAKLSDEKVPK